MSFLSGMKWSLCAFAVTLILGFLNIGVLGAALYYLCYPVLAPFYGNLNDWRGYWVGGVTIWAGMLWSVSFLVAGVLNLQLKNRGISAPWRRGACLAVLWVGALVTWGGLLLTRYMPADEANRISASGCGENNGHHMEIVLAPVFETGPRLIDGPRCGISPWNSDMMVFMAELAPDFKPNGMAFSSDGAPTEAPLGLMAEIYPETFKELASSEFEVAGAFSGNSENVAVYLVRLRSGRLYMLLIDVV